MRRLNTLFIGRELHDLARVSSTNEYALHLLSKSKPPEGTVISAREQYAGRGQVGSTWENEPGCNITLSIILYPVFLEARRQFLLGQAISLAVFDLVQHYFPARTSVKWPNDIYVDDRKIAGILIQNNISGNHLRSCVAGIGINVNQETFSPDLPNPTSFKIETTQAYDLNAIISRLCKTVEQRYLTLKSGKIVPLQEEYISKLYRLQQPAMYQRADGRVFKGRITGVTESGKLIVATVNKEERFDLKEIRFV